MYFMGTYLSIEGVGVPVDDQEIQIFASRYGIVDKFGLFEGDVRDIDPNLDSRKGKKYVKLRVISHN